MNGWTLLARDETALSRLSRLWPIATLPQEFMSAMPPKADKPERREWPMLSKEGFAIGPEAILVQGQVQTRDLDSRSGLSRFDNFKIQFYGSVSDTFPTNINPFRTSATKGLRA
jgi:hypothetical protein